MKISRSTILIIILWVLGFTHVLGGPYSFFKLIFWIALLPYIISTLLILFVIFKAKKVMHSSATQENNSKETIHVKATVKEE